MMSRASEPAVTRPKRALLSLVVNAHAGNAEALTGRRKGSLTLCRCKVAGCVCNHFTVADGTSFGVCSHCNHGAMYHSPAEPAMMANRSNHAAISATNSNAPAAALVAAPPMREEQKVTASTISSSVPVTPVEQTLTLAALLGIVDNLERSAVLKTFRCEENDTNNNNNGDQPLTRPARCGLLSQALTLIVRASDMVNDRLAILRREEAAASTTAASSVHASATSSNQTSTLNSKSSSVERSSNTGTVSGHQSATSFAALHSNYSSNNNGGSLSCERAVLQRRSEQLQQHMEKVRGMLAAAEGAIGATRVGMGRERSTSTVRDDDGHIQGRVDLFGQQQQQRFRAPSLTAATMMMMATGPVEADFLHDGGHYHGYNHIITGGAAGTDSAGASRAASLDGAYSTSLARQQLIRPAQSTTAACAGGGSGAAMDDSRDVRLCQECLETTLAPFCHNCGTRVSTTLLIRAPSPNPCCAL